MPVLESTIRTYTAHLNSLSRDLGHSIMPEGYGWLKDHKTVFETIKVSPSANTWNNKLFAVKYLLDLEDAPKSLVKSYEVYITDVKAQIDQKYADNKKSDKEEANWLTKDQLMDILDDLEKKTKKSISSRKDYKDIMKYLCLKIHIETPLRNDLANAKIFLDPSEDDMKDQEFNYIALDSATKTAKFIDNVYKTKERHGRLVISWSADIAKELFHYYKDLVGITYDNFFLTNNNGDKMTPNNYTKFLKSIFTDYDKNISSSMIRHIVVSDLYDLDEETEAKKKQLAHNMGHTKGVQSAIYAKV